MRGFVVAVVLALGACSGPAAVEPVCSGAAAPRCSGETGTTAAQCEEGLAFCDDGQPVCIDETAVDVVVIGAPFCEASGEP